MQDQNSSVCGIFGYFQGELVSKVGMTVGWAGRNKEDKPTGAAAYRAGDLVKRAVGTQPARMKASGAGE